MNLFTSIVILSEAKNLALMRPFTSFRMTREHLFSILLM